MYHLCMEPLSSTAAPALRTLLNDQPTTAAKVTFVWTIVAGPALSRATTPVWSRDGTLYLRARTDAWRQELRRSKPVLLQRLNQLLGAGVVRRLDVS
jgi:predicted nucleic acid-binding Zn ribbon protein